MYQRHLVRCVHGISHYSEERKEYVRPEIQALRKWQVPSLNLHQKRVLVKHIIPI